MKGGRSTPGTNMFKKQAGAPTSFLATDTSSTQISFSWVAPTELGKPECTYAVKNSAGTIVATAAEGATSAIWATSNQSSDTYYVYAINSSGETQSNADVGQNRWVAGAPTSFNASDATVNSISFTWAIPSNQGNPACSYQVRNSGNGVVATSGVGGTSATYNVTGPHTDTFHVISVNSAGNSGNSNTNSGTSVELYGTHVMTTNGDRSAGVYEITTSPVRGLLSPSSVGGFGLYDITSYYYPSNPGSQYFQIRFLDFATDRLVRLTTPDGSNVVLTSQTPYFNPPQIMIDYFHDNVGIAVAIELEIV